MEMERRDGRAGHGGGMGAGVRDRVESWGLQAPG